MNVRILSVLVGSAAFVLLMLGFSTLLCGTLSDGLVGTEACHQFLATVRSVRTTVGLP